MIIFIIIIFSLHTKEMNKQESNVQLYCDLDGVLADFNEGTQTLLGKYPDELSQSLLWSTVKKSKTFYEDLPWMPEGKKLWENIKKYNPIILTGCPYGYPSAIEQKLNWCLRELGPNIKVITCKTKDKPKFCNPNSGDIEYKTDPNTMSSAESTPGGMPARTVSIGNKTRGPKTEGITMRGYGAATKGIKSRGPMA